jgi:hypothetical protein
VTASFADNEIWHVMIADDMKRMNVDQLDDAFRLSLVDASTMVWKAGMNTWARLGSVAGIDDEAAVPLVTHRAPPPPPRPLARPVPKPPSPSRVPQSFHTAITPVFQAPTLIAPVYAPPLQAPDPYVLPKRRVAIPSEVDFRRSSSGVRWGRWLVALLLLTGGVLGAYRQNLLREGARRLGIENKYLHGEQRVTAFVSAKAPGPIKLALTRLKLLPGPNAAATAPAAAAPAAVTPAAVVESTKAPELVKAAEPAKPAEPEMKTVSLDSLPVLTGELEAAKPAAVAPAAVPHRAAAGKPAAVVERKAAPAKAAQPAQPAQRAKEKPEPVAKAEPAPKPRAAPPPPAANDNPLKAAIRQAIAADNAKK